jgi:hypothetical protein
MALHRYNTVKTKVTDPNAIERATRSELTALKISIPLGLITGLGIYAGVQTGALQPFNPEGLDTETHYNYFSRYLFYSGYIPGLIMGLMGGTWMKILLDSRIDSLQGFDSTILFEDQRKGFWRYQFKNFFKHPSNKWAQNQIHNLKIIISNLSAAATTILVTQLWGMGRVDVGMFLAGYIVLFITPLAGFSTKIDQSFELSKAWVSSRIPARLRAHPKAQDFISKELQRKRLRFTFFEEIFAVVVTENIAGSMLVLKDNAQMGTRAFLRMVFGGEPPTVLINNGLQAIQDATQRIPGFNAATEALQNLFTNNYEALDRYPERLLEVGGDASQRVYENPNLPQNALGEFLGKAFGAALTLGGFAAIPYAASYTYEQFKQRWLQLRGQEARQRLAERAAAEADDATLVEAEEVATASEETTESAPASPLTCSGLLTSN